MVRKFRKGSPEGAPVLTRSFTPPPPASPVELGLVLRTARERRGLSLEVARDVTGVPSVDLEALERGRLELLHVEQAAIVGLWRYAELLGMDPAPLVEVLRTHWPRAPLAVDALYSNPGGAGMPNARLALGEDILNRIVPKASEATAGGLGLSAGTRRQLVDESAHGMLAVAVLGPAPGARRPRLAAPASSGSSSVTPAEPAARLDVADEGPGDTPPAGGAPGGGGTSPGPAEHPRAFPGPSDVARSRGTAPASTAPTSTAPASTAPASTAPASTAPTSTAPMAPTSTAPMAFRPAALPAPVGVTREPGRATRGVRGPAHLFHVLAERFGVGVANPLPAVVPARVPVESGAVSADRLLGR